MEKKERCYGCQKKLTDINEFDVNLFKARNLGGKSEEDNWIIVCKEKCSTNGRAMVTKTFSFEPWLVHRIEHQGKMMWPKKKKVLQQYVKWTAKTNLPKDPNYTEDPERTHYTISIDKEMIEKMVDLELERKFGIGNTRLGYISDEVEEIRYSLNSLKKQIQEIHNSVYQEYDNQVNKTKTMLEKGLRQEVQKIEHPIIRYEEE